MAAKGGGAWKVAYADFVTAMMAFFLVMWLCAQDQKVREAVAGYFLDPVGSSRKPGKTGAVFQSSERGDVPQSEAVALGRGRASHTTPRESSHATKVVSDWLDAEPAARAYWKVQAQQARQQAATAKDVLDKVCTADEAAVAALSRQMKDELLRGVPSQVRGLHRDLVTEMLADVNWTELAEDLLAR